MEMVADTLQDGTYIVYAIFVIDRRKDQGPSPHIHVSVKQKLYYTLIML